jgi:hypothetical protein
MAVPQFAAVVYKRAAARIRGVSRFAGVQTLSLSRVRTARNRVAVSTAMKLSGLVVLFTAGALLAGAIAAGGRAAEQTTTTTTTETTTAPGSTVITTATVQQTTTRRVIVSTPGTTTSASSSNNGTPAWAWVLLGILAVALVVLIVVLARRGGGTVPAEERRQRLDGAVSTWAAQGWALESQSADSAVLRRGSELMLVSVDQAGQVSTRPLPNQ